MTSQKWYQATKVVMAKAKDGFRLSELRGLNKAVADRLINSGKLEATPLPNGDWIVNKK